VKRDPFVIVAVAMVISLLLALGVRRAHHRLPDPSSGAIGSLKTAPDFALASLDGKTTIRLSDYRGKAVLLNFWATWCVPCKIEMPWFVELQNEYGSQGLQVVGVAMDDASPEDIAKFAKDMGVNYPIAVGKESVGDAYGGVQFLPASFYIGRDGKVVDKVFGLKGKHEIQDDIKKALAQGSVPSSGSPSVALGSTAPGKATY
jgi:peroxiredoxin